MKTSTNDIVILVNLDANDGKAESKWLHIRDKVYDCLGGTPHVITYRLPFDLRTGLGELMSRHNIKCIISAGGDGSLNYLINHLMTELVLDRQNLFIGAIGLGSSNDALKPFGKKIKGIPVNIDMNNVSLTDIGQVVIGSDNHTKRYFLNNVSFGVTANANALFNKGDFFINLTKKKLTNLSIIYSALRTILSHKNISCKIEYDNNTINSNLSSLSIIKTPFLAGVLRYDQNIGRGDESLGMNLCDDMTKLELIRTVMALTRSKFNGRPKCISVTGHRFNLVFDNDVNIEIDGEINSGIEFNISLQPHAIHFISSSI